MALTRSQLLMGNSSQGVVLPGQPQGVTQGSGILIASNGQISVDASTVIGLVKLNNPGAYNSYAWPNTDGLAGTQLTTDGSGNLTWADPDGIPWTALGQLVVGTGFGTQVILNAGTNTAVLLADNTAASGLRYSNTATSAILTPVGTTAQRPGLPGNLAATAGQIRFNTDTSLMELYNGTIWLPIGSAVQAGLGINLSGTAPNEAYKLDVPIQFGPPTPGILPAESIPGSLYWDDNLGLLFIRYFDGTSTQWVQVTPVTPSTSVTATLPLEVTGNNLALKIGLGNIENGGFLKATTPIDNGPPTPGLGQFQSIDGSLYWDDNLGLLFIRYNDGTSTQWVQVTPVTPAPVGFSGSFVTPTQTVTVVDGLIISVV